MSFKSMIQDMKDEFGSISRKGFRSRSHRVVQDCTVTVDALRQSCWANMPPELLRDVLMRIEESDSDWRPRKNVVACAGVCRSWREIMKEIVKTPEVSGQLTFPISLKQPGPRDKLVQCFIRRNRSSQTKLNMMMTTKCLFLLCLCLVPFVVFSSTFTSQNPIDLPSATPVPILDTNGKEVDPRSSYRMVYTNRGPYGGDIYLDYSPGSTAPCPDGVFRYGQVGPKGTPVRLITPSHFGPGVYEEQQIKIQFVISNVEKCGDYTIWKVGPYDREERTSFLETGQEDSKSCFKIVKSPRLLGYELLTCDGGLVGTMGNRVALVANYSLDFDFEKVED